jgi:hypothetical protein
VIGTLELGEVLGPMAKFCIPIECCEDNEECLVALALWLPFLPIIMPESRDEDGSYAIGIPPAAMAAESENGEPSGETLPPTLPLLRGAGACSWEYGAYSSAGDGEATPAPTCRSEPEPDGVLFFSLEECPKKPKAPPMPAAAASFPPGPMPREESKEPRLPNFVRPTRAWILGCRLRTRKSKKNRIPISATPPTTPPAIAPLLVDEPPETGTPEGEESDPDDVGAESPDVEDGVSEVGADELPEGGAWERQLVSDPFEIVKGLLDLENDAPIVQSNLYWPAGRSTEIQRKECSSGLMLVDSGSVRMSLPDGIARLRRLPVSTCPTDWVMTPTLVKVLGLEAVVEVGVVVSSWSTSLFVITRVMSSSGPAYLQVMLADSQVVMSWIVLKNMIGVSLEPAAEFDAEAVGSGRGIG